MAPTHPARFRKITACLDSQKTGLEYGPLNKPLLHKDLWPNVLYVDHASRDDLIAKYTRDASVIAADVPEIDIVTGGELINAFLHDESMDFVVASHVAEHVPDLLGWIESNLKVIKPGGHISLAFPDRRYCFDFPKLPTSLHEIVAAYVEGRTQPNFTQICDQIMNSRMAEAKALWDGSTTVSNTSPMHSLQGSLRLLRDRWKTGGYTDVHCWKYSDLEFLDMLNSAQKLIGVAFEPVSFFPTQYGSAEFFVTLQKI